jgi:hypothetical protein
MLQVLLLHMLGPNECAQWVQPLSPLLLLLLLLLPACDGCPAGPMGPAGPPLLFCPFNVVWKVAVGVCKSDDHISATATCPHGTFLMSSGCAGYTKGCKPGHSPPVRVGFCQC